MHAHLFASAQSTVCDRGGRAHLRSRPIAAYRLPVVNTGAVQALLSIPHASNGMEQGTLVFSQNSVDSVGSIMNNRSSFQKKTVPFQYGEPSLLANVAPNPIRHHL